jgi:hypothetical protein
VIGASEVGGGATTFPGGIEYFFHCDLFTIKSILRPDPTNQAIFRKFSVIFREVSVNRSPRSRAEPGNSMKFLFSNLAKST